VAAVEAEVWDNPDLEYAVWVQVVVVAVAAMATVAAAAATDVEVVMVDWVVLA